MPRAPVSIADPQAEAVRWAWDDAADADVAAATSCGLDLWHAPRALAWTGAYLDAKPARLTLTAGSEHAAVTCLLRRLPGGWSLASAYPYARIAGSPQLFWRARSALAAALRKARVVRLEMPFTGPYAEQLAGGAKVRVPAKLDAVRHVLDLDGDAPACRFDANARWAVRKARRSGCTTRAATAADIDRLQDLYARTMRAKGAPVHYGRARWQGLVEQLAPNGQGAVWIGLIDGQPRGMAAVVDGAASRHLLQLAVPPDAHASRLGELLVATAIDDAHARGLRYFDFMASAAGDAGLIAFKAKWGTRAEPIRHAVIDAIPGLARAVDLGRWALRTKARFGVR